MKSSLLLFLFLILGYQSYSYDLVVAKDGTGDFYTVQEAINAATAGTAATPFTIFIKNGRYFEKDTVPASKPYLQLIGESVGGVSIAFNASATTINPSNNTAYGTSGSATFTVNANNFTAMNITFENTTGKIGDGPQALAINVGRDKCAFKNCRFIGGQDTVLANGNGQRQYFKNCYIDGNTDFIFGSSTAMFDSCVIFGRDRIDGSTGGIITAANTPSGQTYGYVFRDCRLPAGRITTYSMGRPWGNSGTPNTNPAHNKVVFIRSRMNSVKAAGWDAWDAGTNTSVIFYAEYASKFFNGIPVPTAARVSWSYQIPQASADTFTIAKVLTNATDSWNPDLIPGFSSSVPEPVAVANLRVKKSIPQLALSWNSCWPMSGVKYELFRSHDNAAFSKVYEEISTNDTNVSFFTQSPLVSGQSQYYFYVKASKAGYADYLTDTVSINTSIPLNGEFRSVTSGLWGNGSTWEKYDAGTSTWIQQAGTASGSFPNSPNDLTIRTGHTVTLGATSYCNAITIENGGTLNCDAPAGRTLRVITGILNSGTFGGLSVATNQITLEYPNPNVNMTLTGTGVYNFYRVRPLTGLVNAGLVIDANVTLSSVLAAWYNNASNTANETITVTINKGATVTASFLHNSNPSNTNNGGTYKYNINGTLDMSASTTASALVPSPAAGTGISVNVGKGGLIKFGQRLQTVNTAAGTYAGKIEFHIADSGRVDGSQLLPAYVTMGNNWWDIAGTGSISRTIAATPVVIPVRYEGAIDGNSIAIANNGTSDVYTIGLRDTINNLAADQLNYVKRLWRIAEDVPGGSDLDISFNWLSTQQTAGFNPATAYLRMYNGSTWDSVLTSLSGAGTAASPYVASVTDIVSPASFAVFNPIEVVALSIHLKSFTGLVTGSGHQLQWTAASAEAGDSYELEHAAVDGSFQSIYKSGPVTSANGSFVYVYATPAEGLNYYRLRLKSSGRADVFSSLVVLQAGYASAALLAVPNPVAGKMNVQYQSHTNKSFLAVYDMQGTQLLGRQLSSATGNVEIDLSTFAAGHYLLQLSANDGSQQTLRFVKQ